MIDFLLMELPARWTERFSRELRGRLGILKRRFPGYSSARLAREASRYLPPGSGELHRRQVERLFEYPRLKGLATVLAVARVLEVGPQELARWLMEWPEEIEEIEEPQDEGDGE